jgi:hypothetical protein
MHLLRASARTKLRAWDAPVGVRRTPLSSQRRTSSFSRSEPTHLTCATFSPSPSFRRPPSTHVAPPPSFPPQRASASSHPPSRTSFIAIISTRCEIVPRCAGGHGAVTPQSRPPHGPPPAGPPPPPQPLPPRPHRRSRRRRRPAPSRPGPRRNRGAAAGGCGRAGGRAPGG